MERVAEPFPAFACTTSVPPSWVLLVKASISSSVSDALGVAWIHNIKDVLASKYQLNKGK